MKGTCLSWYCLFVCVSLLGEGLYLPRWVAVVERTLPLVGLFGDFFFGEYSLDTPLASVAALVLGHGLFVVLGALHLVEYGELAIAVFGATFVVASNLLVEKSLREKVPGTAKNGAFLIGILDGVFVFFSFLLVHCCLFMAGRQSRAVKAASLAYGVASWTLLGLCFNSLMIRWRKLAMSSLFPRSYRSILQLLDW
ncbi:hypothetical protein NEDG_00540 [Nematocida displodere]|uniref:Uncharacterized protein n=1 Tax=Nematocida displodere TaxID=1805483 RepID=A0A177EBU0_9MICR|nr:hypothetical protein NEDG_00540 [Nematocida displodere]